MPRNAAQKDVVQVYAGKTLKFQASRDRGIAVNARLYNPSFDTDAQVKFQSAPNGRDHIAKIAFAGPPVGTYAITVDGVATAAIAYSATPATNVTNIQSALDAALGSGVTVVGYVTDATDIRIRFTGAKAKRSVTVTATQPATSGSTTVTVQAQGAYPGTASATDATGDGYAAATLTIKPRGTANVSFDHDNDSENLLGPFINVVGVAGTCEIELSWDETHVHQIVN